LQKKVACKQGKSCNIKFLQPAHRTTFILSILEAVGSCKKVEKLALIITSEGKSNKQQNQATHSFSLTTKPKLSTDLIFHSQQI